jgi:hypothetical protein
MGLTDTMRRTHDNDDEPLTFHLLGLAAERVMKRLQPTQCKDEAEHAIDDHREINSRGELVRLALSTVSESPDRNADKRQVEDCLHRSPAIHREKDANDQPQNRNPHQTQRGARKLRNFEISANDEALTVMVRKI